MIDFSTGWNQVLATIITGALIFLIKQGFQFLHTKTDAVKSDALRQGLYAAESEAERLTLTIVSSLNQTVVGAMKAANGNVLTPEDAARIKSEALANIHNLLSDEAKRVLKDHKTDLFAFLGHLLEEMVGNKKSEAQTIITADLIAKDQ